MKYLFKVFRKIILGEQREIKLAYELAEIIKNYSKKSHIKILDYGSGYNPVLIKKVINELTLKHKKTKNSKNNKGKLSKMIRTSKKKNINY